MRMQLEILPVHGLPEIKPGDDLPGQILQAALASPAGLRDGDVLVIAQKVVSKAEGRLVDPGGVEPSAFARTVAERVGKPAAEVEVILQESSRLVRMAPGTLIMETRHGYVCANAGIDTGMSCGSRRSQWPTNWPARRNW